MDPIDLLKLLVDPARLAVAGALAAAAAPLNGSELAARAGTDPRTVLAQWFEGRQLSRLPTNRTQRLVVLERLALEFEPGRRYPETEVNSILGQFHSDWSMLRRALVDHGFLDRANSQYWRAGGRVPT